MPYRLHVANLRAAAASKGDTTDYQIMKRTGISKSAISRLVNYSVEPTITTLKRFMACYDVDIEDLVMEVSTAAGEGHPMACAA